MTHHNESHIRLPPHPEDEKSHPKASNSLFWWLPKEFQLILCAAGVYLFYLGLGGYQEKLLTTKYGQDRAPFPSVFFLLACMCVGNAAVSFFQILLFKPTNNCGFLNFAQIGIPYLGGMVCSYSSVAYLDFPTQVLAKSCKPIPVMFMGVFILRRKYPLKKYFFVVMISFGVALFSLANPKSKEDTTTTLEGIALLLLSLIFDSFTGPLQERLLVAHSPSPAHMMLHTNVWATIFCFIGLTISGQLSTLSSFLGTHPEVYWDLGMLCVCSAFGQIFITEMVHLFDSLTTTIVTTTRKLFTLLVSIIFFGHKPLFGQWIAIGIVFLGLSLDSYSSYSSKKTVELSDKKGEKKE